jgi:hypothetical protein
VNNGCFRKQLVRYAAGDHHRETRDHPSSIPSTLDAVRYTEGCPGDATWIQLIIYLAAFRSQALGPRKLEPINGVGHMTRRLDSASVFKVVFKSKVSAGEAADQHIIRWSFSDFRRLACKVVERWTAVLPDKENIERIESHCQ